MAISSDARKKYIQEVIKGQPIRYKKVFYREQAHELPVFRLELQYLIFNQFNDRIAVEMRTREARLGEAGREYTDELEDLICDTLWKDHTSLNKRTLENLQNIGQQEPGVVTLDGVIIDGNRRAMLLKKHLKQAFFEAAILNEELENDSVWIRRLETQIQFGVDAKVDYEPIAKYLKVKELIIKDGMTPEDVAPLFNEKPVDIKEYLETMNLMDEYLDYIDCPGIYTLLRFVSKDGSREDSFLTLRATINQLSSGTGKGNVPCVYTEDDIDNYKLIYFDYIRSECEDPKVFRKLAPAGRAGGNSGGIFMSESLMKDLVSNHKKEVIPITMNLAPLDEYAAMPENKKFSIEDIAKKREMDWQEKVKKGMKERLLSAISHREDQLSEREPSYYLNESWKKLNCITDKHLEMEEFIDDPVVQSLVKKLNRRIFEIKKVVCDS